MTKRAFVIGADCNGLKYARSDAEKIANALKVVGYDDIDGLPTTEEKSHDLVQRFKEFAHKSKPNDTLIFYFAGHGKSINNQLYLALDSSNLAELTVSGIDISSITSIFQSCNARNKLLILDCCESAQDYISTANSQNYQVLSAAEKWQQAIEFSELQGGFLSYHIEKFLTAPPYQILYTPNSLTISELVKALQNQVIEHNRNNPHQPVPNFITFGKQSSDFEIAQIKTLQYAGLLAITPQFIAQERCKHESQPNTYRVEQFYGANPQVQWWGVAQGLVAKRQIHQRIKEHINTTLQKTTHKPIITLLLGGGGMGKSTLLRQLAVDLSEEYPVFWLEDWGKFAEQRIGEILANESSTVLT